MYNVYLSSCYESKKKKKRMFFTNKLYSINARLLFNKFVEKFSLTKVFQYCTIAIILLTENNTLFSFPRVDNDSLLKSERDERNERIVKNI